uniref:Galectin n=1 Tax=Megaselia scalaris TaxID=36166 RepID=T1GTF9_MEGSC
MKKDFTFGAEEKDGRFPFVHDQEFKIAFGFTEHEFLIAIDGTRFASFKYRTTNALNTTVGLKITCLNGLKIHVTNLDHVLMANSECKGSDIVMIVYTTASHSIIRSNLEPLSEFRLPTATGEGAHMELLLLISLLICIRRH